MTQRQFSIRIGIDGKAEITRDFDEIAQKGDSAFESVQQTVDRATGALGDFRKSAEESASVFQAGGQPQTYSSFDAQIQRWKSEQASLANAQRQLETSQARQSWYNGRLGVSAATSGAAQASMAVFSTYEAKAAALRAQIDPLSVAQSKMNAAVADAGTLLAAGTINEAEHTAAVALARKAYAEAESALKNYGAAGGFGNTQMMALTAAIRHMIDATIAGRPALQSLAMESGNLSYGLSGTGGLMGAFRAVGGMIAGLLSPTVLLGIAIGGVAAITGAAYYGYLRQQEELQASLSGLGKAAGATVDEMKQIADASAAAGDVSVSKAREIEEAFARSGKIGVGSFSALIGVVKDYAATTGEEMDQAQKELVSAFTDPAKGADLLNAKLGFLDDKTRNYIVTLAEQGRLTEAQNALLQALKGGLDDAADHTTGLGRAWDFVARNASNAWTAMEEAIGEAINGPSLVKQLADLQQERADAAHGMGRLTGHVHGEEVRSPIRPLQDIDADISAVTGKIDALKAKANQTASDAVASNMSVQIGAIARAADEGYEDYQKLLATQKKLNDAMADPAVTKRVANLQQARDAQDAYNRAVATYLTPAQRQKELDELEIRALNDKTPAQKRATAQDRERIEIAGKVITTAQAQADITRAGVKAYADATHAISEQSAALFRNAAMWMAVADAYLEGTAAGQLAEAGSKKLGEQIGQTAISGAKQAAQLEFSTAAQKKVNDAVAAGTMTSQQASREMQTQNALAPLLVAQTLAEGEAKAELTKIINALRAARQGDTAEQVRAHALQQVEASNDNIDLLKQEIRLQGEGDNAREQDIAALQAKKQLVQQGIDAESDEGKQIIANAIEAAKLNQQLNLAKSSRGELEGTFDSVANTWSQFIVQGKYDWTDFAKAGLSACQDIESEIIKLAAINPLKNLLFGTNLPTMSSVGGIFGDILGNGGSASSGSSGFGGFGVDFLANFGVGHAGMMAGFANSNRALPANVLRFAPRMHDGMYLGPDEVPAILQTGERVLNRSETQNYNRREGGVIYAPVNIQTPNPQAFRASKGQIVASLARAVRDGARRM